jgi:hypothetical protein
MRERRGLEWPLANPWFRMHLAAASALAAPGTFFQLRALTFRTDKAEVFDLHPSQVRPVKPHIRAVQFASTWRGRLCAGKVKFRWPSNC